ACSPQTRQSSRSRVQAIGPRFCPSGRVPRIFIHVLANVHVPRSPADESFVRFRGAGRFVNAARVHRVTNPVQHEPCRALHYSERVRQFVRADTVLAVRQEPHCSEPLVERNGAILEDRPDLDGELLLAVKALPCQSCLKKRQSLRGATRAGRAIRPLRFRNKFQTNTLFRKVASGFDQTLWEVGINWFHEVSLRSTKGGSSDLMPASRGSSTCPNAQNFSALM